MSLHSTTRTVKANEFVAEDGYIRIKGEPGTHFSITLLTQNTRHVSAKKEEGLSVCSLGFVQVEDVCVCSTETSDRLVGVVACGMVNFQALLQVGYWIGCSHSKVLTGLCPFSY